MAPDSGDDDASALRERVCELEQTVADLKTERQRPTVGRRGVLGALAGAAGLGAVGVYGSSQPAAAQAAGQVGTASDPVDVFGYTVEAGNGVTTASITDPDSGQTFDVGSDLAGGEVLTDPDGDNVYTLPNGSDGIDVGSVTTDKLILDSSLTYERVGRQEQTSNSGSDVDFQFTGLSNSDYFLRIETNPGDPSGVGTLTMNGVDGSGNGLYEFFDETGAKTTGADKIDLFTLGDDFPNMTLIVHLALNGLNAGVNNRILPSRPGKVSGYADTGSFRDDQNDTDITSVTVTLPQPVSGDFVELWRGL